MAPRSLVLALALAAPLWGACSSVRLGLPFVAQAGPHLCGVACVEMLGRYHGRRVPAAGLRALEAEALATGGVSGASMKSALEGAGYGVAVYPGTLDRALTGLLRQVDRGLPVVVMTGAGPRHYCVVSGYDEGRAMITLMDPGQGRVGLPFADFERRWGQAGHFALVAEPPRP